MVCFPGPVFCRNLNLRSQIPHCTVSFLKHCNSASCARSFHQGHCLQCCILAICHFAFCNLQFAACALHLAACNLATCCLPPCSLLFAICYFAICTLLFAICYSATYNMLFSTCSFAFCNLAIGTSGLGNFAICFLQLCNFASRQFNNLFFLFFLGNVCAQSTSWLTPQVPPSSPPLADTPLPPWPCHLQQTCQAASCLLSGPVSPKRCK